MALGRSALSPFQREILEAFFKRTDRFFLTGGAALAGFHLGHRTTQDLDLFTTEEALEEGASALEDVARALGVSIERVSTSPTFRRFLLRSGSEGIAVDLVRDASPQGYPRKTSVGVIRLDPPEEILANKLCALLSRAEIRDLVDVLELERAGCAVDTALPLAMRKDGGLTPAQLAWVLSQIRIPDAAKMPGDKSAQEIRTYLQGLVNRLTLLARPS